LETILKGEPKFRLKQVKKEIFGSLIEDWAQATSLPLELRNKLNEELPLKINAEIFVSKDAKSAKALIVLKDGLKIESVLMRYDKRNTVCVSSQVGCALGCKFCITGKMGFKRNLETSEIIEQVLLFARFLKKEGQKVANIVFMGMGEPFLNYENVMDAVRVFNGKDEFNIGARHVSVSTAGIVEGIEKMAEEKLQTNLAISLHAPNNDLRSKIMPINKKYPIETVLRAVDEFVKKTNRQVMFEYLMLQGVNDSNKCAEELAELMRGHLYFVNLILYNPTGIFDPPPRARVEKFKEILKKRGVGVGERYSFGKEIKAACGQLATKN